LFAGLNVSPKKSYLSEYSSRINHTRTTQFLSAWHELLSGTDLFAGESFNLAFPSVPYSGEDPVVQRHFVSARSHDIMETVNAVVRDFGGSFLAEHGIGRLKTNMMEGWRGGAELDPMKRIRAAVDPQGLMNRGKVLRGRTGGCAGGTAPVAAAAGPPRRRPTSPA